MSGGRMSWTFLARTLVEGIVRHKQFPSSSTEDEHENESQLHLTKPTGEHQY